MLSQIVGESNKIMIFLLGPFKEITLTGVWVFGFGGENVVVLASLSESPPEKLNEVWQS